MVSDRAPAPLALAWRQYRLERRLFWRNPSAAFFNFLLPLLFLVAGGIIRPGNPATLNKLVPSIAGMAVMSTTFTALSYNIVFLRERGVLKRIRGTPLPTISYFGGVAANAVTNTALQIAIIVVAGKVFFGLDWPPEWGSLVGFVVAGVVCFAALGVGLAHPSRPPASSTRCSCRSCSCRSTCSTRAARRSSCGRSPRRCRCIRSFTACLA